MIYIVNKEINVLCCLCGKRHSIDTTNLKLDTYTIEKSMGDEIEYSWIHLSKCPNCDREIRFNILAYEYPPTQFNWKDFEKNNCSFDSKLIKFGGCHGCDDFDTD